MDVARVHGGLSLGAPGRARATPSARGCRSRVGCDNACTFCIVPFVRGAQRSRAIGDVLAEVQGLARDGVVEVTLLGQNVNTYGRDVTVPGIGAPAAVRASCSAGERGRRASAGSGSRRRTRTTSRRT